GAQRERERDREREKERERAAQEKKDNLRKGEDGERWRFEGKAAFEKESDMTESGRQWRGVCVEVLRGGCGEGLLECCWYGVGMGQVWGRYGTGMGQVWGGYGVGMGQVW